MTLPPNWKNPKEYPDPGTTRPKEFAWEFLRRNPKYQESYREYAKRYSALLKSYPRAETDDAVWVLLQNDPRAEIFEPPKKAGESDDAWEQRVGSGFITPIFEWYSRPWGMRIRPADPADDSPGIFWERSPGMVRVLTLKGCDEYLVMKKGTIWQNGKIGIGFDLALPVAPQIKAAERYLNGQKKWLRSTADSAIPAVERRPKRFQKFVVQLRALDGEVSKASIKEIGEVLFPTTSNEHPDFLGNHAVRGILKAATAMRDDGYRDLLMVR